ncbi:MAG: hypothetical protein Q4E87_08555 [bacterium]|nr:hypothetical protein [bacterium]
MLNAFVSDCHVVALIAMTKTVILSEAKNLGETFAIKNRFFGLRPQNDGE